uniref:TPR_REGION domain-containing protein n=1 Tax=Macrostomum lignano TaxID=282301 RepID=A0A1I8ITA9_9PLAT
MKSLRIPMFMWYLFSALFDEDVPSDSDTSDDDDYDYHRPWQLNGHGAASQSSESNDHRSPTYHNREKVIRTAEEAEKNANELIEAEEQRKEQQLKRDEKKRKKREKKLRKKQNLELQSSFANANGSGGHHGNGGLSHEAGSSNGSADHGKFRLKQRICRVWYKIRSSSSNNSSSSKQQQQQQQPIANPTVEPIATSRELAKAANACMAACELNRALQLYCNAISLNPTDCRYYGSRAACLYQLDRFRTPTRPSASALSTPADFYMRGLAQLRLEQPAEACASFAHVLAIDPNSSDAAAKLNEAKKLQLESMGFTAARCEEALNRNNGNMQLAADWLMTVATAASPHGNVQPRTAVPAVSQQARPSSAAQSYTAAAKSSYAQAIGQSKPQLQHHQQPLAQQKNNYNSHSPTEQQPQQEQQQTEMKITALWVGNVMPDVSEEQLCAAFARHGSVVSARLLRQSCCAFVNMRSQEDARRAMMALNGQAVGSRRLLVKFSASGPKKGP